jgi:hypothetical protein
MKNSITIWGACLVLVTMTCCNAAPAALPQETVPLAASEPSKLSSTSASLFLDTGAVDAASPAPHVARSRLVKLNLSLLLADDGQPRSLALPAEIQLDLFPEVHYTGIIEQVQNEGDAISWIGHLKEIEYSELTMVYTGGIFIAHFASPQGVYEVSLMGDDVYRIIQVDQSKLEGGDG